ncbi:MAG: lasso RiPP family leader peptide-containing protein [Deltaproteobacteria bacterium]|nr:lasso RiPP family leader peptide-containing protein [Deltaproteobacteria bacterium]
MKGGDRPEAVRYEKPHRRPYAKPRLVQLGNVRELTLGPGGSVFDGDVGLIPS